MSIGLASGVPSGAETTALTDLYRLADGALYEAKTDGRNRTRCAKLQDISAASQKQFQVVSAL